MRPVARLRVTLWLPLALLGAAAALVPGLLREREREAERARRADGFARRADHHECRARSLARVGLELGTNGMQMCSGMEGRASIPTDEQYRAEVDRYIVALQAARRAERDRREPLIRHHRALGEKYRRAAADPARPVAPDPPAPPIEPLPVRGIGAGLMGLGPPEAPEPSPWSERQQEILRERLRLAESSPY